MNAQTPISPAASVYSKIATVQGELAKVGISKSRRNAQQGYDFRGIDEVYAALSPLLASNGLVIVPRVISRECVEGQTRKGDPLFRVTVHAEFDFVSADDGSIHTAATFGEAMDSADKATNKAMSAAYKYAAFMTFAIPTEGDNDADSSHHEIAARGQSNGSVVSPSRQSPDSTENKRGQNWGGRYPTKTAMREARVIHHAEIERIGGEGTFDDLEGYLTSPEYKDYIATAMERFRNWLEGDLPEGAPPEYVQTFKLEQKARDLIALRGNVPAEKEQA